MLRVKDLKTLRKLKKNNKKDELAFVEETMAIYKWDGGAWRNHVTNSSIHTSLYQLNRTAYNGMPELSEEEIKNQEENLTKWREETNNNYYMLLNNEERYYTVFVPNKNNSLFGVEVISCLKTRGIIKSIELLEENNSFECWITHDDNSYVYYLFPYDEGVVECQ